VIFVPAGLLVCVEAAMRYTLTLSDADLEQPSV
jgi:hypothetical protein